MGLPPHYKEREKDYESSLDTNIQKGKKKTTAQQYPTSLIRNGDILVNVADPIYLDSGSIAI